MELGPKRPFVRYFCGPTTEAQAASVVLLSCAWMDDVGECNYKSYSWLFPFPFFGLLMCLDM